MLERLEAGVASGTLGLVSKEVGFFFFSAMVCDKTIAEQNSSLTDSVTLT